MRRCLTALLVVGLISLNNRDAAAQTQAEAMAAVALTYTPVGALAPILFSQSSENAFAGRFSHFSPKVGDGDNSLGATFYHKAGTNAVVSGTLGYTQIGCPTGFSCDNVIMAGGDVQSKLWDNSASKSTTGTSINLQGSLGYGKAGDTGFLSAAVGLPLGISMEQASKARISAFITPSYGWGSVSDDAITGDKSGMRPLVGAGAAWSSPAGWGLHASFNKVMIKDGGNSFGVGFSYKLGK